VRRKEREKNIIFLSDRHVILQEVDDEEAEDAPKEDRESDIKIIDEDNQREEQKKKNIEERTSNQDLKRLSGFAIPAHHTQGV
jgi:hypothetical protein